MAYCSECGIELDPDVKFCSECGNDVQDGNADVTADAGDVTAEDLEPESPFASGYLRAQTWQVFAISLAFALLVGFLFAWGLAETSPGIGFLIGVILGYVFPSGVRSGWAAFGNGLYTTALALVLVPVMFYFPQAVGSSDPQTAGEAGAFVGSVLGLFIYTIVFAIVGLILFVIGYFAKKRSPDVAAS